jgi:hypothetical protein
MNAIVCLPHEGVHKVSLGSYGLATFKHQDHGRTILVGKSAYTRGRLYGHNLAITSAPSYGEFTIGYIRDIIPVRIDCHMWIKGGHVDKLKLWKNIELSRLWVWDDREPVPDKDQLVEAIFENDDLRIDRYHALSE